MCSVRRVLQSAAVATALGWIVTGQRACAAMDRESVGRESRTEHRARIQHGRLPDYLNPRDTEHARHRSTLLEMVPVSRLAG